jgi:HAE1 family hydrophobic/amphiphilic exporter-1
MVILISVPLATLGGFLGLAIVHQWSVADRYMPVQNMDVLTILGFVILAGVVVNNAILIVHQTLNFLAGRDQPDGAGLSPRDAIIQSVQSRVRPILMSTLTSVGGMLPLVLMPGSGSELYRGLGAVVVGGLAVSTVFTLILVPVVLSVLFELPKLTKFAGDRDASVLTAPAV